MLSTTKERIIEASTGLFRERGYTGTGLKAVAARSRVPWGSLYHHFPAGKEQLVTETVQTFGSEYEEMLESVFSGADTASAGVGRVFDAAARSLEDSDFASGCLVGVVALEAAGSSEAIRGACAEALSRWTEVVAHRLAADGVASRRADELALYAVTAIEGAFLICRALRDVTPMKVTRTAVIDAIDRASPADTRS